MAQSLAKIYVHIVFSTKNRTPWITELIEKELYAYMSGVLKALQSPSLIINGMPDHCHIFARQSKNIATSKLIQELKGTSSGWIKNQGKEFRNFKWQNGYGVFSVSQSQEERLRRYILNQKEHHRKISFKEEFRMLLHKYKVVYDEKYVWD